MFMEQNKLKIQQQKNLKQNSQGLLSSSVPSVPSLSSVPSQNSLSQELVNNNIVYNNSSSNEAIPQLTTEGLDEALLNETNPEILNELYKLINMQNQENALASSQDPSFNPALLTPDSLLNSTSSPLNPDIVSSITNSSSSNNLYDMINPVQKENIIVPSEEYASIPNSTTDPNLLLMMNNQNPNKNLAILNQPTMNTIDPTLIGPSTSAGLPNAVPATLPNTTIDQNSLLTMSLLNGMPSTFTNIQPQPALASPAMPNIDNSMYQINAMNQLTPQPVTISKPIVSGSMNYRESIKEKNQPINDELFANMIHTLHQKETNDGYDEDDLLIQQINRSAQEIYTTGMPSPSPAIINNGKNYQPSTPDELSRMGVPYTPEDLDSESNKSGEVTFSIPRGLPEGDEESDNSFCASTNEKLENANRDIKVEEKRSNSTHSTLQFPADQKPTKLNIPYSVFPRVTQETVDSFINEAKLSEEELECLCSELKSKATCKEKLNYISKKVEIEGWTIEKWNEGRKKFLEGLCEEELKKEKELEKKCCSSQIKVENQ